MGATKYTLEVKRFQMLTPTVFELAFEPVEPPEADTPPLEYRAGQFISIVIPGAGPKGRDLRRAYSIASTPEQRPVELCVKVVDGGPGTNYLSGLRPGDRLTGWAPYGDFVYKTGPDKHACFIATGTGVAPFRSMILSEEFQKAPPKSATCLLGVREESELLYVNELEAAPGLKFIPAVSRPCTGEWKGFCGRVTQYLQTLGDDFPWLDTEYYLCGAGAMIDEVKELLLGKGVTKGSIHQEIYYKMPKPKA